MVLKNCIRQAVCCYITNESGDMVLAGKQHKDKDGSLFYFLGGGVEGGESYEEAALRELREEASLDSGQVLGLEDSGKSFLQVFNEPAEVSLKANDGEIVTAEVNGQERRVVQVVLKDNAIDSFISNDEMSEVKWFKIDELKEVFKKPQHLEEVLKIVNG